MFQAVHRAPWLATAAMLVPACNVELESEQQLAAGGWDNNTAFWNAGIDETEVEAEPAYAPDGVGPSTLGPSNHVLFQLSGARPSPCVALDSSVSAVRIVGSRRVSDRGVGPTLEVLRGTWGALPVGATVDVQATAATEGGGATSVVLRFKRLGDVTRPQGSVRWPHYAVTMVRDADCSAVSLPVSIIGPAPDLPAGSRIGIAPLTSSFALYASYYGEQMPSLVAKAAINFDQPLFMAGESGTAAVGCLTGAAVSGNRLVFLSAFAIGATVVTYHPLDASRAPLLVHMTRPGEPIKLHGLQASPSGTEDLCHAVFAPPGTTGRVPIAKLGPPMSEYAEIDVIHADAVRLGPLELAASSYTWFAHGRSSARRNAFLQSSLNLDKLALSLQATTSIASTRLGLSLGALMTWSAIRSAAIGRVDTLIAAETLPPSMAAQSYDHAMVVAVTMPTCGDGICGAGESCGGDCMVPPPPIGPVPGPTPPAIDAGVSDAPIDAGWSPDAGTDGGMGSDGGSGSDGGY